MTDFNVTELTETTTPPLDTLLYGAIPGPLDRGMTRESLLDYGKGFTVYRIFDGMADDINSVWQAACTDTGPRLLEIGPRLGSGQFHTLNGTAVTISGAAATSPFVIRSIKHPRARLYTQFGSLTWTGATGPGDANAIDWDFAWESPNNPLTLNNPNFARVRARMTFTQLLVQTLGSGGQAEFNEIEVEMSNAPNKALRFEQNTGWGSMRGTRLWAYLGGSTGQAFYCENSLYHSQCVVHVNGFGTASLVGGVPTGDPVADGYDGDDAVVWLNGAHVHGADIQIKEETGSGDAIGLWLTDPGDSYEEEFGLIRLDTIWKKDYLAVTDIANPVNLPRYLFGWGGNGYTEEYAWAEANGGWTTDHWTNIGGPGLLLE